MDFSCGEGCIEQWGCSWCHNNYCDHIISAYCLEGKPKYWSENDVNEGWWNKLTEKQKNKLRREYSTQPPTMTAFFLCDKCKEKYIENNICKGRNKNKIGRKKNDFWLR